MNILNKEQATRQGFVPLTFPYEETPEEQEMFDKVLRDFHGIEGAIIVGRELWRRKADLLTHDKRRTLSIREIKVERNYRNDR